MDKISDEDLMRAYQNGDQGAFLELYKRYAPRIYGYILPRVKNRAEGDDLFQQIFMKLHKSRGTYKTELPFAPWIFSICRTVMADFFKQRSRSVDNVYLVGVAHGDSTVETLISAAAADYSSYTAADSATAINGTSVLETEMKNRLSTLSDRERIAIESRYLSENSFFDIAQELSTSESNTRQIISRALRKLKSGFGK